MATLTRFDEPRIEQWDASTWEAVTLHLLWQVCHNGVHGVRRFAPPLIPRVRHRDLLLEVTGQDTDRLDRRRLDPLLRRVYRSRRRPLATSRLSGRPVSLVAQPQSPQPAGEPWLHGLPAEIARIEREELTPLQVIDEATRSTGRERIGSRAVHLADAPGAARLGGHGLANGNQCRMDRASGAGRLAGRVPGRTARARTVGHRVRRSRIVRPHRAAQPPAAVLAEANSARPAQ